MRLLRRVSGLAPAVATCGAVLSSFVAVLGYMMLGFLYLTRHYAPASHHYIRPLHFDYTSYVAIAVAPLSPNIREQAALQNKAVPGAAAALVPKSRFLPSGSQVDVYVSILLPSHHDDLFQLTGELLVNNTHVAARSTRTHINPRQPWVYRAARRMMLLPLHLLGLAHHDRVRVTMKLFDPYEEREELPVNAFRARLFSRNASRGSEPPPPVHHAELHVRLKLGMIRTVLYWLRPGLALTVVLLMVGSGCAFFGSAAALGLAVLACLLHRWVLRSSTSFSMLHGRGGGGGGKALPYGKPQRRLGGVRGGGTDDPISYSLAHASFFGDGDGDMGSADDAASYYEEEGHGKRHNDNGVVHGASSEARRYESHGGSPGWSDDTEGVSHGTAAAATAAAPDAGKWTAEPSRVDSMASNAATPVRGASQDKDVGGMVGAGEAVSPGTAAGAAHRDDSVPAVVDEAEEESDDEVADSASGAARAKQRLTGDVKTEPVEGGDTVEPSADSDALFERPNGKAATAISTASDTSLGDRDADRLADTIVRRRPGFMWQP